MPFIPHTVTDIQEMLQAIGASSIDDLFDEIPADLRITGFNNIPAGLTEMEMTQCLKVRAMQDEAGLCFIGAGAYEHHIPAAVWELVSRGEFMTAYTPYQAEASQGTLQLIYEYQTMMASLLGMEVSNASLYDGASALAEAVLMAVRANTHSKSNRILLPTSLHPFYRQTIKAIVSPQAIELVDIAFDRQTGTVDMAALNQFANEDVTALVIPQPNFFGAIENVDALTDWAHERKALAIAVVNPTAMALLREPGQWGQQGIDIACGEGQPLGVPLASGGPYFGFLACKKILVRQMPGRIVGRTTDLDGKMGFALTLQAREQHIRRAKATSNICTNQGLLVTAATIYMSLLGPNGLRQVAAASHKQAKSLQQQLLKIPGIKPVFSAACFHEFVVQLPSATTPVLQALAKRGIQGGYSLHEVYPELDNALLICVTETKTDEDLKNYVQALQEILSEKTSC
jgi:glycine dehydrogenase subunit 1